MYYENEKLCVKRIHTPSQLQFAEEPLSEHFQAKEEQTKL